jgi:hypothetical protein
MIDFALVVLALMAGGVAFAFYATARAPLGYEDERGFHFAEPQVDRTTEHRLEMVPESTTR